MPSPAGQLASQPGHPACLPHPYAWRCDPLLQHLQHLQVGGGVGGLGGGAAGQGGGTARAGELEQGRGQAGGPWAEVQAAAKRGKLLSELHAWEACKWRKRGLLAWRKDGALQS